MMPTPSKFILTIPTGTIECTPDNWAEVEMGLTRQEFGVNREVTSEFVFSGTAGAVLTGLFNTYGFGAVCSMEFHKRQNNWTYELFNTFQADFSTYSLDNGKVTLSFIENSIRKLIDDNKGTDYQFDLPTTNNLLYTGVSFVKENKMLATAGLLTEWVNASCFPIRSKRTVRQSTTLFDFAIDQMEAIAKATGTFNVEVSIKTLAFHLIGNDTFLPFQGKVRLVKTNAGSGTWKETLLEWNPISPAYGYERFEDFGVYNLENVSLNVGERIMLWYDAGNHAINSVAMTGQHLDTYLKLTNIDPSIYQAHEVPVVSHDWAIEQLIRKIVPSLALLPIADILEYNLPKITDAVAYVPVLTSGSGLIQDSGATITVSLEKVLKSLKFLYGADYDITGNKMRVDYASTFFSHVKSTIDIEPIAKPVIKSDMTHVYNRIVVGWETDENATNGALEINCKNTFTIPNSKVDKELNLVHPFKGSMYTIEKYMEDKDTSTNTTKDSDTSVFIFAVNPLVANSTTLHRPVTYTWAYKGTSNTSPYPTIFYISSPSTPIIPVTGAFYRDINSRNYYTWNGTAYLNSPTGPENLPPMAYNVPFSPMRLMLANMSYIAVSLYLLTKKGYLLSGTFYEDVSHTVPIVPVIDLYFFDITGSKYYKYNGSIYVITDAPTWIQFASTDRKADYFTPYGGVTLYENALSTSLIPEPLFLPLSVEFDTALKLWTLASINDNLYKYWELVNKNTSQTYKIWIKDVTLQLTRVNSQSWKGIAYDL